MDRKEAKQIMDEVAEAAAAIFEAHGLDRGKVRSSYDTGEIKVTVQGVGRGDSSPYVADWNRYHDSYDLPADGLGKRVVLNGSLWEIVGLMPSRTKYPVRVTNVETGKAMLFTAQSVRRGLGY